MALFGPDFPFDHAAWLAHPDGLGQLPAAAHGTEIAIIGAGLSGLVAGYELMRLGLKPVIYEADRIGGRLRSHRFEGAGDLVAELGGMRFPLSSTAFHHYVELLGLRTKPFPNPLTAAAGSTVIDLQGETVYAETEADLPPLLAEVQDAYDRALEEEAGLSALKAAMRARDHARLRDLWAPLIRAWDERTFYDFVASSRAFSALSFRHREVFGQVGFGTGGWDSDFPNSMLEILRVAAGECDRDQMMILGGADQLPRGLWARKVSQPVHWPAGVSLAALNAGSPRPAATRIARSPSGALSVTDRWGHQAEYPAVIVACQTWLLTTSIATDEALFSQGLWMALDRTRYMGSSKTFVMVDRPFWRDRDPATGREVMSMTLTDRITRGTYLIEDAPDAPAIICLTYSWEADARKMLPLAVNRRVELALESLSRIYPGLDIASHIRGAPVTVSWEADPNFLGAFKGALPGHYRYNRRMFGQFMQDRLPPAERGIFLAGDDISWTPGWAEGAVQTALNAVWGVIHQLGGTTPRGNPGPGDVWPERAPPDLDGGE